MPFYTDDRALYACLQPMFERIQVESPEALQGLMASRLALRLKCSAPAAEVTFDGRQRPLQTAYGRSTIRPDLDIEMSADTLHQILMDTLSMKKAMGSGLIKVRGPAWKLKAMIEVLKAGRLIYSDVLQQQKLL
jgi:hypothetical protein